MPFVRDFSQQLIQFAKENRLLFTLHDRFCRFDKWETTNKEWNPETNRFNEVPLYTEAQAREAFKGEMLDKFKENTIDPNTCLLYTSPSPRDRQKSRMPSSA